MLASSYSNSENWTRTPPSLFGGTLRSRVQRLPSPSPVQRSKPDIGAEASALSLCEENFSSAVWYRCAKSQAYCIEESCHESGPPEAISGPCAQLAWASEKAGLWITKAS